jgi:hypothetical protein
MKRRDQPMARKDLYGPNNGESKRPPMAKDSAATKPRVGGGRGLDARSQEAIGRSLKAHYEDLVRAPVPDKFLEMLDRLEAAERSKPQGAADEPG